MRKIVVLPSKEPESVLVIQNALNILIELPLKDAKQLAAVVDPILDMELACFQSPLWQFKFRPSCAT